jgi:hypothetical protein
VILFAGEILTIESTPVCICIIIMWIGDVCKPLWGYVLQKESKNRFKDFRKAEKCDKIKKIS